MILCGIPFENLQTRNYSIELALTSNAEALQAFLRESRQFHHLMSSFLLRYPKTTYDSSFGHCRFTLEFAKWTKLSHVTLRTYCVEEEWLIGTGSSSDPFI